MDTDVHGMPGTLVVHEDLFRSTCQAWVNPVNTVGVLGAGLALAFKMRFPDYAADYLDACRAGRLSVGTLHAFDCGEGAIPRWIISLPTKRHWRDSSSIQDIDQGLAALRAFLLASDIQSIAIPALGCGLGGLEWKDVAPRIQAAMQLPARVGIAVRLYHPMGGRGRHVQG